MKASTKRSHAMRLRAASGAGPKSTAKKGNPKEASRGAAVERAKGQLGELLEYAISFDREAASLALLGKLTGLGARQMRERVKCATLAELEAWIRLVEQALPAEAEAA
jgi:hypothetical protein